MRVISDLHLHGRFSRATSKDLTILNLERFARMKGLDLLGTGDFTHPKWLEEIKNTLSDDGSGILRTKTGFPFILQTEISSIYSDGGRGRRVHNVILAPSIEVVEQINEMFLRYGRLDYDGRPIFKLPCPELVDNLMRISEDIEVIPAHIWTPWFSVFGSSSGYNSIEECFKDKAKHIHALETGLSSDPAMNWRLSSLDKYALVSNSDSHSFWPWRIGRECNVFDIQKLSYNSFIEVLRTKKGFTRTIEFWPHEGKYHYDGHRNCGVVMTPAEAIKHKNICPICKNQLTIGVAHRVEELADRPEGFVPKGAIPYTNLIPLSELIAGTLQTTPASKKVWTIYNSLINRFGNELNILLDAKKDDINSASDERIADVVIRNREQKIKVLPGYDGEYGKPIFDENVGPISLEGEKDDVPDISINSNNEYDNNDNNKSKSKSQSTSTKVGEKKREQIAQKGLGDFF